LEGTDFVLNRVFSKAVHNVHNLSLAGYCEQISSKKNAENELALRRDTTLYLPSKKKSPASKASGGSARLRHSSDCSKPVHNHFLKTLF